MHYECHHGNMGQCSECRWEREYCVVCQCSPCSCPKTQEQEAGATVLNPTFSDTNQYVEELLQKYEEYLKTIPSREVIDNLLVIYRHVQIALISYKEGAPVIPPLDVASEKLQFLLGLSDMTERQG